MTNLKELELKDLQKQRELLYREQVSLMEALKISNGGNRDIPTKGSLRTCDSRIIDINKRIDKLLKNKPHHIVTNKEHQVVLSTVVGDKALVRDGYNFYATKDEKDLLVDGDKIMYLPKD